MASSQEPGFPGDSNLPAGAQLAAPGSQQLPPRGQSREEGFVSRVCPAFRGSWHVAVALSVSNEACLQRGRNTHPTPQ